MLKGGMTINAANSQSFCSVEGSRCLTRKTGRNWRSWRRYSIRQANFAPRQLHEDWNRPPKIQHFFN